jgi:hypothetical protein
MRLSKCSREWLEWVLVTSVPLRCLDAADTPVGIASGCLIDYTSRRFLLSVKHAVDRASTDWVIDLGYEHGKGTSIYRLRSFNYVAETVKGSGVIRDIDFCFTEVPNDLVSIYQNATSRGISDECPRHVFQTDLSATPDDKQIFAFAGQVKPEIHKMHVASAIAVEMNVYPGLRFIRTEGEFHIFKLPVSHPGHDHFKGCSGAPIVDMNKQVVALVCDGDPATNTIRSVSTSRYKFAIDFICRSTNGA